MILSLFTAIIMKIMMRIRRIPPHIARMAHHGNALPPVVLLLHPESFTELNNTPRLRWPYCGSADAVLQASWPWKFELVVANCDGVPEHEPP